MRMPGPTGATAAGLYALPHSPSTQFRSLFFGHAIAPAIAVTIQKIFNGITGLLWVPAGTRFCCVRVHFTRECAFACALASMLRYFARFFGNAITVTIQKTLNGAGLRWLPESQKRHTFSPCWVRKHVRVRVFARVRI